MPETQRLEIALIGNPNTGKSTLFNALTGLRQRVGNYSGVTVEKKTGDMPLGGKMATLIDLPGTYSLAASSPDERVVVDALSGQMAGVRRPDVIICVLDATNLTRNLFLASQVADLEIPMVLVLNQWDLADRRGLTINLELMKRRFGVPVVPMVASKGVGVEALRSAIEGLLKKPQYMKRITWSESIQRAVAHLRAILETKHGQVVNDVELRRILFDADSAVADRFHWGQDDRKQIIEQARKSIREAGLNPYSAEAVLQYRHLNAEVMDVLCQGYHCATNRTESIDRLLTHRVWGLIVFAGMMWFVFQAVYTWAGPLMDIIDGFTGWLQGHASTLLAGTPMIQSLVTDGLIGGVGGVLIFLPQILILFFFVGLLEDTGYMPRAAFLMDKIFGWCGLNGKSFVPLLSSYACSVPGILSARTIEDPKARLATILIAPLMSCSARLPVYVLLIGVFIEPEYGAFWAGFALFAMHFVGLLVALPVAWVLTRLILRTKRQPFLIEMCAYRVPRWDSLVRRMWEQGREFAIRAGTVIVAFSIIIWALLYFPRNEAVATATEQSFHEELAQRENAAEWFKQLDDEDSEIAAELDARIEAAYIENSYMGRMGKAMQPIFDPAGFDWKITVGVVASFPAREVIIATLGITYSLGAEHDEDSEPLRERMLNERWPEGTARAGQPVFTIPVACAIMVFFALCLQCGATVAVVARESSLGWAIFAFVYMTVLAWSGAVVTYQIGTHWF